MKSATKNGNEVTLHLSTNMVSHSNNETNFPYKLLLTDTQVSKFGKAFANNSSANLKLSKTQLFQIVQSGGFFGRLLGPLPKTSLPLIKIYFCH